MPHASPGSVRRAGLGVAAAALAVAALLRAPITGVPPILSELAADLHFSATVAGVTTSLPLVCFGVFAFAAPLLVARIGLERALLLLLMPLSVGLLLRSAGGAAAFFVGTVLGFLASAALVTSARFPAVEAPAPAPFVERVTRGTRIFWASRELRGLLGLNLTVATTTAMVIVNTAVLVQGALDRPQADLALLLAAYGGGSMLVALALPRVLDRLPDRPVMLAGAAALPMLLLGVVEALTGTTGDIRWAALLVLWALLGAATAAVLTPSARLLRRNSTEQNRSAVYAAQFSLSHACFLLTYPLAGWLGAAIGLPATGLVLVGIGAVGLAFTLASWRGLRTDATPAA